MGVGAIADCKMRTVSEQWPRTAPPPTLAMKTVAGMAWVMNLKAYRS
jgi:hypothetical protein